jgi:hypothetical protein
MKIKERVTAYSAAFKTELDKRQEDYKSGKAKIITAGESKRRIQKILKAAVKP